MADAPPHPTKHLFRVLGSERPVRGVDIVERLIPAEIDMTPEKVLDFIRGRAWRVTTVSSSRLPLSPAIWTEKEREIVEHFKHIIAVGRPVDAIVVDVDGMVLVGHHRAVAAQEMDAAISAYVPLKI